MVSLKACFSTTLVLLLFGAAQFQVDCASSKIYLRLLEDLEGNYTKPYMRPVNDTTEPVSVGVRYAPVLATLDAPKQELTVRAMLAVKWKDFFLQWQPEDYDGINETTFPISYGGNRKFWTPELSLYQSIDTDFQSFYPETDSATLTYLGEVHWYTLVTTKSYCMMENTWFPFDKQNCTLTFTTWLYQTHEQIFERIDDIVENGTFEKYEMPNALWNVEIQEPVEVGMMSYDCETCRGKQQSYIRYRLSLTRSHSQAVVYIMLLGLPCITLSILMAFIPFMGGVKGADVPSYGLTCTMGLFVYLVYLQTALPSTGLATYAETYVAVIIIAGTVAVGGFVYGTPKSESDFYMDEESQPENSDNFQRFDNRKEKVKRFFRRLNYGKLFLWSLFFLNSVFFIVGVILAYT